MGMTATGGSTGRMVRDADCMRKLDLQAFCIHDCSISCICARGNRLHCVSEQLLVTVTVSPQLKQGQIGTNNLTIQAL